jgi:hypothetical protein
MNDDQETGDEVDIEDDVPPDPEKFNWKPGDVTVDHLEVPKAPRRERPGDDGGERPEP